MLSCAAALRLENEANASRQRWVILSRGERQAKEAMDEGLKRHLNALNTAFQYNEIDYLADAHYKALEVTLPGGSRITGLPANPDTARGFSANCFLDEFAHHQDSRKIWQALFPVTSAGFRLIVTSTPNGKANKFYDLFTGADSEWYRQTTDIYQAVKDGLPRNIQQMQTALNDADAWQQEYEVKWLDEASAWLDFDLINSVEHEQAGLAKLYQGNQCFVGVDIAARKDLFVIWVLELIGDVLWTREIFAKQGISFAQQDMQLERIMTEYKKIRIPAGDTTLRYDLHKLKKETSSAGNPRFIAAADATGHADRTWACFLAINAANSMSYQPITYKSIQTRKVNQKQRGF